MYYILMRSTQTQNPTKDLLEICSETIQLGISSYNDLESQNEKLSRANNELAEIHHDLKVVEKKIDGLESLWGKIVNYFTPSVPEYKKSSNSPVFNQIILSSKTDPSTLNDYIAAQDADIDKLIEQTEQMKKIAINMGTSLDQSSILIDKAVKSAYKADIKGKQLIEREKKIMS